MIKGEIKINDETQRKGYICVCLYASKSYDSQGFFISLFFLPLCSNEGWMEESRGRGAGGRLTVTRITDAARQISLETHTHSYIHTNIMHEKGLMCEHTHTCSLTHDLNFNGRDRKMPNLASL